MPNIRKPNNLHKIDGTFRKDRHGEEGDSLDDADLGKLPPPPIFLTPTARDEWVRVTKILGPAKLLKGTDMGIMVAYCKLYETIASNDPDLPIAAYGQFRMVAGELGLTPAARSKTLLGNNKEKGKGNEYGNL